MNTQLPSVATSVRRFAAGIIVTLLAVSIPVLAVTTIVPKAPATPKPTSSAPVSVSEEQQLVALIERSLASVVSIVGSQEVAGSRQILGRGTGFVIDASGLILTNRHVVSEEKLTYRVYFADGRRYDATVVGRDQLQDLALVKINAEKLPVLKLGDSDKLKIGQTAIAIGNSLGRYPNTVTRGIISGVGRSITAGDDSTGQTESLDNVIQTDAEINLGNSGGPLLNSFGEVVGIDTAIEQSGRGVGFAIPINEAKKIIDSYKKSGRIIRPYLGIRYTTITSDLQDARKLSYNYGALVDAGDPPTGPAVVPLGPADKAGLRTGDIILSVNDQLLRGALTLYQVVQKHAVGDTITLKVYRGGTVISLPVKLEEVPS